MEHKISNAYLNFTCTQNWNAMQDATDGKFCDKCQKTVYDLTDKDAIFLRKIMAENQNSICARFSAQQLTSTAPHKPYWKKWISAAMIFIGLGTLLAERAKAQESPNKAKSDTLKTILKDDDENVIFGSFGIMGPEFRGGEKAFGRFIAANLVIPPKTPKGEVLVSFIIDTDGSLADIGIIKGLSQAADAEAKRVLSLSPKWRPAVESGKNIVVAYAYTISFNRHKKQESFYPIVIFPKRSSKPILPTDRVKD